MKEGRYSAFLGNLDRRAGACQGEGLRHTHQRGRVLIALQNAFYHLAHTRSFEAALVDTVGCGGDTDTNGAIVGALLGAADGRQAIRARWTTPVLGCGPIKELAANQPRPAEYWPADVIELAEALLATRRAWS